MKKTLIILVVFIIIVLLIKSIFSESKVKTTMEKRAIFISYIELDKYFNNKSYEEAYNNFNLMIDNVYKLGFNEVIVQVRSFGDAIYKSNIYPDRYIINYDLMEMMIDISHKKNISFIAWINPYRVSLNIDSIKESSPAYKYIGTNYLYVNNGVYFNPSKDEVTNLIVNGVEEVCKYDVDGILFDDYFYPSNDIDIEEYNEYIKDNPYITKESYNLNIISEMINKVHNVCRKNNVLFGVSPDGNMENNYNKVYADVKRWCASDQYIDFIMPQVYYGFFNQNKPFNSVCREWNDIIVNKDIKLIVALAFYKVGNYDKYAGNGSLEWQNNNDIIMRQIIISRNLSKYSGFALFRYDYLFDLELYNQMTVIETQNMKKILN